MIERDKFVREHNEFRVEIGYLVGNEIRKSYFKARSIQEAVRRFDEVCSNKIIYVILDPALGINF